MSTLHERMGPSPTVAPWRAFEVVAERHLHWPDAEAAAHWLTGGVFYGFSGGPLDGRLGPFKAPVPDRLDVPVQVGADETHIHMERHTYHRGEWVEPCIQIWVHESVRPHRDSCRRNVPRDEMSPDG